MANRDEPGLVDYVVSFGAGILACAFFGAAIVVILHFVIKYW
jgi:hypothetical protein